MKNYLLTEYAYMFMDIPVMEDRLNAQIQFYEKRKMFYEKFFIFFPNEQRDSESSISIEKALDVIYDILEILYKQLFDIQPKLSPKVIEFLESPELLEWLERVSKEPV